MLIEKSIDINDVATIKFITGEEIIAKVVALDEATVQVTKPLVMTLSMDQQTGRPAIQMVPFFTLGGKSDSKITLQRSHMLVFTLSNDEAKAGYIHNTSGLVSASSGNGGLVI